MSTLKSGVPRSYHHGDLREALIAAAITLLEEGADAGTFSLREAARRAGVSAMAPYRHFADRDALWAAVAEVGFVRLAGELKTADGDPDGAEALVGQGLAYVRFAVVNPGLFRLMFGVSLTARHGALAVAGDAAYAVMAERVATMVPPDQRADRSLRCWSVVHGLASLAIDGQLAGQEGRLDQIAERILRLENAAWAR